MSYPFLGVMIISSAKLLVQVSVSDLTLLLFSCSVPQLKRVAKKLGIDCAPAMIGWDFHAGGSHPAYDGWVVCAEFEDALRDAHDAVCDT